MTTKIHTDIAFAALATSPNLNAPLGQLDSAIADIEALFGDYVVTGGLPGGSASLTIVQPACRAFVINSYVQVPATSLVVSASKDNYVDLDTTGAYHITPVTLGAAAPAVFASSVRLYKAVAGAGSVTSIVDLPLGGLNDDLPYLAGVIAQAAAAGGAILKPDRPPGSTTPWIYRTSDTLPIVGNCLFLKAPMENRDYSDYSVYPGGPTYGPGLCGIKVLPSFPSGHPIVEVGTAGQTFYTLEGGIEDWFFSGDSNALSQAPNKLAGDGVRCWNAHTFKLRRIIVQRLLGKGIYMQGTLPGGVSRSEVERCMARDCGSYGIQLDGGMVINTVSRSWVVSVGDLGFVNSGNQNVFDHNHAEAVIRQNASGINGTGYYNNAYGAKFTNNDTSVVDYHGMYDNGNGSVYGDNSISNVNGSNQADGSGIFLDGTGTNRVVHDNPILDNRGGAAKMVNGIRSNIGAGGSAIIHDNPIVGSTGPGFFNANSAGDVRTHDNSGYNPVGVVVIAVPATGVAVAAAAYRRTFYVTAGVGGCTMTIQSGPAVVIPAGAVVPVDVPAQRTVTPTFTNAPTWVVEGE
jgi:hypothetical protein